MKQTFFIPLLFSSSLAFGLTPEELKIISIQSGQQLKAGLDHSEMMQKKKESILQKAQMMREARQRLEIHEGLEIYKQDGISVKLLKYDKEDLVERYWPTGGRGFYATNVQKAVEDLRGLFLDLENYIENCNRFPLNLEDLFKPIHNAPKRCEKSSIFYHAQKPWLDPWGKSYQTRYNKERMKIQIRSVGRYSDELSDDVIREKHIPEYKDIFKREIEKCNSLPKDDKSCAFNRGWH